MTERLMVIGADAAGMSAASQARRRRRDLDIVAFEKGGWTSYSACGIPYLLSGDVENLDALVARTPAELRNNQQIDVRLHHEVTAIDTAANRLTVRDHGRGRDLQLGFDQLLIATGARPLRPDLPGIHEPFVFGVQTLDDAAAILAYAEEHSVARVVVVGGGYIGVEMAEAFLRWGAEVTLVEAGTQVMRTLDPDMAARVAAAMEAHGVVMQTGVTVRGFEPGRVLTDSGAFEADLVVLGLGVVPNTEIAGAAGIELGVRGAIRVDQMQRSSSAGVWAAGDCAESFHRVSRRWVHIALGTVANRQGRVAGINLGGGYATFGGVVGTAVSKICNTEVARTGLTEAEASAAGFAFATASITSTTRAGYFPGAKPITVKILAEKGTGRLLGGQIVGEEGAAKRIDVLATALVAEMTVEEVLDLDLAYAPPFSPVWDPVVIAAREVAKEL